MRMREVYVDSILKFKGQSRPSQQDREEARLSRTQGKPERYRCTSESDRARHAIYVERSIGGRTQSIIGRGYKELELSQVNSCDTG